MNKVEFYFDVLSPYSYVAFKQLQRLKVPWNLAIKYLPVNLPQIIKEANNTPPSMTPARVAFKLRDLGRVFGMMGIRFNLPKDFLRTPMQGARLSAVAATKMGWDEERMEQLLDAMWSEFFEKGNAAPFTQDPKDLKDILKGLPQANELVARAAGEEARSGLDENTQNALEAGAFGVPTMIITRGKGAQSEFFFGSDRFHHIAVFLSQDPTDIFPKSAGSSKI